MGRGSLTKFGQTGAAKGLSLMLRTSAVESSLSFEKMFVLHELFQRLLKSQALVEEINQAKSLGKCTYCSDRFNFLLLFRSSTVWFSQDRKLQRHNWS